MNTYKQMRESQIRRFRKVAGDSVFVGRNYDQYARICREKGEEPKSRQDLAVLADVNIRDIDTVYLFVDKDRREDLQSLLERFGREFQNAIDRDKTGEGFILDVFEYHLDNADSKATPADLLAICGLTEAALDDDERFRTALKLALGRDAIELSGPVNPIQLTGPTESQERFWDGPVSETEPEEQEAVEPEDSEPIEGQERFWDDPVSEVDHEEE